MPRLIRKLGRHWSGPDTYNSVLSRYPGQTMFAEPPSPDYKTQADWGFNWTDFPVMNMHPHAWPLYSAAKLLGLEFHETEFASKWIFRWRSMSSHPHS